MRARALVLLVAMSSIGCTTYHRGQLAAASATVVPVEMATVEEHARGTACGAALVRGLEHAINDALRRAQGSDALADVSFHFERLCLVVRGTAVRVR